MNGIAIAIVCCVIVYVIYTILDQMTYDFYRETSGTIKEKSQFWNELYVIEKGTGKFYTVQVDDVSKYEEGSVVRFHLHLGGISKDYLSAGIYK